jgi:hypothetical protein
MSQNKINLFLFLAMLSLVLACKKGANDSFISLKSRDNRVVGEWQIVSYEDLTEIKFENESRINKVYYDGKNTTLFVTKNGIELNSAESIIKANIKLSILKNGEIIYNETKNNGLDIINKTIRGNWFWVDTKKNKSMISFTNIDNSIFKKHFFVIDELRNKQITLILTKNIDTSMDLFSKSIHNKLTIKLKQ